jgi:hypothetical protein
MRSLQDATEGAKGWSDNDRTTAPTYSHPIGRHGKGGTVDVSLRGHDGLPSVENSVFPTLWEKVSQLSDLTGDVLLAALAQWLDTGEPENTWITVEVILQYRGIRPMIKQEGESRRKAGYRLEDRMVIARCFEELDRLWLHLVNVEVVERENKLRRGKRLRLESKAVVISDRIAQGGLFGTYIPVAWFYRPGSWATPFLREGYRQTALLAQQSLQYDPYREDLEKRLSRYLAFHWRIQASSANYDQPYRVHTLLEAINKQPNRRYPQRTRERLEKALDRLQKDGVIHRWEYGRWSEEEAGRRNWLGHWLGWTVEISPPTKVVERYDSISKKDRKRLPAPKG